MHRATGHPCRLVPVMRSALHGCSSQADRSDGTKTLYQHDSVDRPCPDNIDLYAHDCQNPRSRVSTRRPRPHAKYYSVRRLPQYSLDPFTTASPPPTSRGRVDGPRPELQSEEFTDLSSRAEVGFSRAIARRSASARLFARQRRTPRAEAACRARGGARRGASRTGGARGGRGRCGGREEGGGGALLASQTHAHCSY